MLVLFEVFFSLVRIIILLLGAVLTLILGDSVNDAINNFLVSLHFPCLGLISFLVIFVTPFAMIYGAHIRRFFWQREKHYNLIILVVSFLIGAIISFLPIDTAFTINQATDMSCNPSSGLNAHVIHMFGTALVTMVFATVGMDLGVVLKHVSHRIKNRTSETKKKTTRKKKATPRSKKR
jgi:RsiW-degrading membrane proteinase PrsW (M82 family)